MSTDRNVTVIFSGINPLPTSTGIERYNIKDMKIGDRIKAYCVPVGGGDYKSDPYITLDINDALDHIEKYHGKKFGTTITVTCETNASSNYSNKISYNENATTYNANMGSYAYKVDKGLLMANIWYGPITPRILNRSNLYSGDRWRLLGPRELSKYILSDLNGTVNPKVNPWGISTHFGNRQCFTFYQASHTALTIPCWTSTAITFSSNDRHYLGWPYPDNTNLNTTFSYGNYFYTSLFLYQYVESENATNIYY